jgi:hypothetical protein
MTGPEFGRPPLSPGTLRPLLQARHPTGRGLDSLVGAKFERTTVGWRQGRPTSRRGFGGQYTTSTARTHFSSRQPEHNGRTVRTNSGSRRTVSALIVSSRRLLPGPRAVAPIPGGLRLGASGRDPLSAVDPSVVNLRRCRRARRRRGERQALDGAVPLSVSFNAACTALERPRRGVLRCSGRAFSDAQRRLACNPSRRSVALAQEGTARVRNRQPPHPTGAMGRSGQLRESASGQDRCS